MRLLAQCSGVALFAALAGGALAYQPSVNFQLHCMGCHLADGSGQPGRVPSIRRSLAFLSATRAGRDYVVRVPGVAQSPLSDSDTAALLNWMIRNLSDSNLPRNVADYSAAEVERLRHAPLAKVKDLRARLLGGMRPAAAGE